MFTSMIIASVNPFTQGDVDKNGKAPVILNVVAGKCPNRNVLSGTIAESMGIEVGKTYLLSVREGEPDAKYGRRFVYSNLKALDALEIVQAAPTIGAAEVFDVSTSVPAEAEAKKSEAFQ